MIQNISSEKTAKMKTGVFWRFAALAFTAFAFALTSGCRSTPAENEDMQGEEHEASSADENVLALPTFAPLQLDGGRLHVVATTSIIGDVVAHVGGDAIDLTVLIDPGVDAHSYQPGARDLVAVEQAGVVFVNGWGLEGGLVEDLEAIMDELLVVPVSAGIVPLAATGHQHDAGTEDGQGLGSTDPHVWFDLQNVELWVENIAHVLSELDPANTGEYSENAAAYQAELEELETYALAHLEEIPPENRYLVTNHDSFGYFALAYGFEVIATVIPAASTLAEPSANDLADLIEEMGAHGICTIFSETSVNDDLAQTAAAELADCESVQVIPLYTEALGAPGSGAETFIRMFTANVDAIVAGLK